MVSLDIGSTAIFKGLAKQYLRAIVRSKVEEGPVIVVLDVAQLLTARERIVLEQAVAGASQEQKNG